MRKQNVTIAGPSHKMRPSSPARALRANNAFTPLRSVRSAKNYSSPASSSAVRPSTKKRHNWNDLEIVANCKDTPIRRCGGNQRGNWRNERRPCVAMTGPTRAGDKPTRPRYGVTLLRWGTGFAGEHGLVEKNLSRGEAHNYSMEVRSDPFESAKSHFFDTSSWGEFCDGRELRLTRGPDAVWARPISVASDPVATGRPLPGHQRPRARNG